MFWTPDQTGQTKQKERSLARNPHPQTAGRAPANSNRETKSFTCAAAISNRKPKLLETLQLQQNKQPGIALIAKKPMFSPSILTHLPQPARAEQSGQRAPT